MRALTVLMALWLVGIFAVFWVYIDMGWLLSKSRNLDQRQVKLFLRHLANQSPAFRAMGIYRGETSVDYLYYSHDQIAAIVSRRVAGHAAVLKLVGEIDGNFFRYGTFGGPIVLDNQETLTIDSLISAHALWTVFPDWQPNDDIKDFELLYKRSLVLENDADPIWTEWTRTKLLLPDTLPTTEVDWLYDLDFLVDVEVSSLRRHHGSWSGLPWIFWNHMQGPWFAVVAGIKDRNSVTYRTFVGLHGGDRLTYVHVDSQPQQVIDTGLTSLRGSRVGGAFIAREHIEPRTTVLLDSLMDNEVTLEELADRFGGSVQDVLIPSML